MNKLPGSEFENVVSRASRQAQHTRGLRAAFAVILALGSLGLIASRMVRGSNGTVSYQPRASVPRPGFDTLFLPGVSKVSGFDWQPDLLLLLDAGASTVAALENDSGGWALRSRFGRSGAGPGEFVHPLSVTWWVGEFSIVVNEINRIHLFTLDGQLRSSRIIELPCNMQRPSVTGTARGLYVTGSCVRRTEHADTMTSQLFWSADGVALQRVASDPLYTLDGKFGTFLGNEHGFVTGSTNHLFGGGVVSCFYRVSDQTLPPTAQQICPIAAPAFKAEAPKEWQRRMQASRNRREQHADILKWPAQLPYYTAMISLEAGELLIRPYSADSSVLRLAGDSADLGVIAEHEFVGCKSEGCLWTDSRIDGTLLRLITRASLERLAGRRPARSKS